MEVAYYVGKFLAGGIVVVLFAVVSESCLIVSGAVAGGVGLVAYALVSAWAVNRFKGLAGSLVSLVPWAVVSLMAYLVLMGAK